MVIRCTNFNGSFLYTNIYIMIYLQHTGYWVNTAHILYITKLHGWNAHSHEITLINEVHIQVHRKDEQTLIVNGLIPIA